MTRNKVLRSLFGLIAFASSLCVAQAVPAIPSFTISGSNVTMPSSGITSIVVTLRSVDGFAGTVDVAVTPPNPPAGVRLPYLNAGGPALGYVLTANGTVTANVGLLASEPVPVPVRWNLPGHGSRTIWELAGVLMLGLGVRRRRTLRSTRLMLTVGLLMGLMGIGACGGPPTLTPGVYTYTLTATGQSNAALSASTTVTVTVPPGIVTRSSNE